MSMWIQSHQSLRNHPKVKKAARLAGINEFEVIGRLHALWWWAMDYAPDGDVTKYTDEDIEDAVDWEGERGKFAEALKGCGLGGHCGFIEITDDGLRLIHDWDEYGGKLIDRKEANAERMRERRVKRVQRTTSAQPPHDRGLEESRVEENRVDNKKLSSPDGESGRTEEPKKARVKTERDLAVGDLEKKFSALSHLPVPLRQTEKQEKAAALRWWNPLGEVWELCDRDVGKACELIERAYRQMRSDRLTISAPQSIVEVAKSLYAANGHRAESDEPGPGDAEAYRAWKESRAGQNAVA